MSRLLYDVLYVRRIGSLSPRRSVLRGAETAGVPHHHADAAFVPIRLDEIPGIAVEWLTRRQVGQGTDAPAEQPCPALRYCRQSGKGMSARVMLDGRASLPPHVKPLYRAGS